MVADRMMCIKKKSECKNLVHNRGLILLDIKIFFTTLADVPSAEVCSGNRCVLLKLTTADFADFDPVSFCKQSLCSWQ